MHNGISAAVFFCMDFDSIVADGMISVPFSLSLRCIGWHLMMVRNRGFRKVLLYSLNRTGVNHRVVRTDDAFLGSCH